MGTKFHQRPLSIEGHQNPRGQKFWLPVVSGLAFLLVSYYQACAPMDPNIQFESLSEMSQEGQLSENIPDIQDGEGSDNGVPPIAGGGTGGGGAVGGGGSSSGGGVSSGALPPGTGLVGGQLSSVILNELIAGARLSASNAEKFQYMARRMEVLDEAGVVAIKGKKPWLSFQNAVRFLKESGIDWNNTEHWTEFRDFLGFWNGGDCDPNYEWGSEQPAVCLWGRITDPQNVTLTDLDFVVDPQLRDVLFQCFTSNTASGWSQPSMAY